LVAANRRQPTGVETTRLRQQATLATRRDKTHRSLAQMTEQWRERAAGYLKEDQAAWVTSLRDRNDLPLLRAGDPADDILADVAEAECLARLAECRRTRWSSRLVSNATLRCAIELRLTGPFTRQSSPPRKDEP
jgi:hypothetical protein